VISRDDFARWRDDPVTRWVFKALASDADAQREAWTKHSWDNGHANPATLLELRTRADAYRAMEEVSYAGLCEALGEQPRED
jgi:hypothetical protein